MRLDELARRIGADLRCPSDAEASGIILRCAPLKEAGPTDVAFLANRKYTAQLETSRAAAVIVGPNAANGAERTLLVADDPYFAFREAMVALHGFREHPEPGAWAKGDGSAGREGPTEHGGPSACAGAVIHPEAEIGENTQVHPLAVVSERARVGRGCVIYPNVFVGPDARIGDHCVLHPNVVVYEGCTLGDRVTLHAGCVIGQDGFGYATHGGKHHKIPQTGNAVIEDDVEMGAGCTIDRATMGSTVIGQGTKFSDLVAIGHGTKVGRHNLFVAQVGVAGSVVTGDHVVIGGQVGVAGHLRIGHRVQIAARSGVRSNIPDDAVYGGTPAMPWQDGKRVYLQMQRLPEMADRLRKLERKLAKLENGRQADAAESAEEQ